MIERSLTLPDQTILTDQTRIDRMLNKQEKILKRKNRISPEKIFQELNLSELQIARIPDEPIGQFRRESNGVCLDNYPIFPERDVTIDLTPQGDIRTFISYKISFNYKTITIKVLFDEMYYPEFRELSDPNNPEKIEPLIREELLCVLENNKWKRGIFEGSWVASK